MTLLQPLHKGLQVGFLQVRCRPNTEYINCRCSCCCTQLTLHLCVASHRIALDCLEKGCVTGSLRDSVPAGVDNPFIYNPAEAKDRERLIRKAAQAPAQWICGETATVEVEIWNPTSQAIKVGLNVAKERLDNIFQAGLSFLLALRKVCCTASRILLVGLSQQLQQSS